ncbi:MAG: amidohydrolase family protein, partial [Chloroflexota bacterium]
DVICTLIDQNIAAGRTSPHWHPRSRPAHLEGEAAGRAIDIATYVGTPIHIFHVSCAAVVKKITQARAQGLPVTGETCPQYLFLTDKLYDRPGVDGTLPVCAPPLRPQQDQDNLWQALTRGELQMVATDHCPFTKADKARGLEDFSQIPGGVPSIEMRFAAIYSKGVRERNLTLNQWVDICCTQPARLMGLQSKGDLAIGRDADLVIFDPKVKRTLSVNTLHENIDWTPYDGHKIQGWPTTVLSRGKVIVANQQFRGAAGDGRFIAR